MTAKKAKLAKAKSPRESELNDKQQRFVDTYFEFGFNATRAAKESGYAHPNKQGPRLLVNVGIRAAIDARLKEMHMGADEVLARLADMASASMDDFFVADGKAYRLDLKQARDLGKMHLVKKVTETKWGLTIELHDPQAALVQLGRYHKLFVDRQEHTGKDGGPIELADVRARLLSRFAETDAQAAAPGVPGKPAAG